MEPDLTTTNLLLGIMAFVSLLQAFAVVAAMVAGFVVFQRLTRVIADVEERHIAPTVARVNDILDDVKGVSSAVHQESRRAERLMGWLFGAIGRNARSLPRETRAGRRVAH
jgi:hypothetical protein